VPKARPEGNLRKRPDGTWEYRATIPGRTKAGRQRSRSFYGPTRAIALTKHRTWLEEGQPSAPERMTVAALMDRYQATLAHLEDSTKAYARDYAKPALKEFSERTVGSLHELELAGWVNGLKKRNGQPLGDVARRHSYDVLHRALELGRKLKVIKLNPLSDVPRPGVARKKRLVWNPEQALDFLDVARESFLSAMYLIAIATGMRKQEFLGLRRADTIWASNLFKVRHTVTVINGKSIARERTKNVSSLRDVFVHPEVMEAVRLHLIRQEASKPSNWQDHDLLFPNPDGTPMRDATLRAEHERLIALSGVPRITIQGLRRTYASLARLNKIDIKIVAERLGHASTQTTTEIYQQTYAESHRDAAMSMADFLGSRAAPEPEIFTHQITHERIDSGNSRPTQTRRKLRPKR
jgi:integrase